MESGSFFQPKRESSTSFSSRTWMDWVIEKSFEKLRKEEVELNATAAGSSATGYWVA